jgi:hypothetical protein
MRPLTRTFRRHYSSVNRWRITLDKLTAAHPGQRFVQTGSAKMPVTDVWFAPRHLLCMAPVRRSWSASF